MPEKVQMMVAIGYIVALLVGSFVLLIGLPVAVFHGVTSGDWTWLLAWAGLASAAWAADRLGLIKPIND
jgi:hypothetical protein